jgi:D-alanyl-D-alanine carboxypeptidase
MKRSIYIAGLLLILIIGAGAYAFSREQNTPQMQSRLADTNQQKTTVQKNKPAAQQKYAIDEPASLQVVINKKRPLNPANYVPAALVTPKVPLRANITEDERQISGEAAPALEKLFSEAQKQAINLTLESGYRSFKFQTKLYNRYVMQQGQAVADTQSARAGYSEHQTGLAADIGGTTRPECNVEACFSETPEGRWVAANARTFGFIIRYPEGKTPVTGYIYEPWHLRYVGIELAQAMQQSGSPTLEEYFKLPAATAYN